MRFLLLFFGFLTPLSVFAYLDPGTGSFIIHVIVGGIVGVSYAVRVFWRNIKNAAYFVIGGHRKENKENEDFPAGTQ